MRRIADFASPTVRTGSHGPSGFVAGLAAAALHFDLWVPNGAGVYGLPEQMEVFRITGRSRAVICIRATSRDWALSSMKTGGEISVRSSLFAGGPPEDGTLWNW